MKLILAMSFNEYMNWYYQFLVRQWNTMTPIKYGILLISIGVVGWILMKSGANRMA